MVSIQTFLVGEIIVSISIVLVDIRLDLTGPSTVNHATNNKNS